jgi:hypothetical protein
VSDAGEACRGLALLHTWSLTSDRSILHQLVFSVVRLGYLCRFHMSTILANR